MALLIRCSTLLGIIMLLNSLSFSDSRRPLHDFDFSGYIQGRFTGFLNNAEKPENPLNTLPDPLWSGGESQTAASIKRLEFTLGTSLPWPNLKIISKAAVGGSKVSLKEAYLAWNPDNYISCQAGIINVPFGLENQQSSTSLATVERSLIYSFGNFGWADSLGFQVINQYDYGLSLSITRQNSYAGFKPFFQTSLLAGSGKNILPSLPSQLTLRTGVTNRLQIEKFRHELNLACSAALGQNRFENRGFSYIPAGSPGDLLTNPESAIHYENPESSGRTALFGVDFKTRMNDLGLSGEWVLRKVNNFTVQGYYVLAEFDLEHYVRHDINLVAKWEDAFTTYADGIHHPDIRYQTVTAGTNWNINSHWRLQINHIKILKQQKTNSFYGSDLFITQLQYRF